MSSSLQRKPSIGEAGDVILCKAYYHYTTQPAVGVSQSGANLRGKITARYNVERATFPERSQGTLQSRFTIIRRGVSLYVAKLTQARAHVQSGANEQDVVNNAEFLYHQETKNFFAFRHVLPILLIHPKFDPNIVDKPFHESGIHPRDVSSASVDLDTEDDNLPVPSQDSDVKYLGRDATKRHLARTKKHAKALVEERAILKGQEEHAQCIRETIKDIGSTSAVFARLMQSREERASQDEHLRIQERLDVNDALLMTMDESRMSNIQRQYYQRRWASLQEKKSRAAEQSSNSSDCSPYRVN